MKARSRKLAIEALEDRCVPSTFDTGDFNHDNLDDIAAITGDTSITVSLANADGSYTVSATLEGPKNKPITNVYVNDQNGDGNPDVVAISSQPGSNTFTVSVWMGNSDGTFGARTSTNSKWPPPPPRMRGF